MFHHLPEKKERNEKTCGGQLNPMLAMVFQIYTMAIGEFSVDSENQCNPSLQQ